MECNNTLKYKVDIDMNNKNDVHVIEIGYIEKGKTILDVGCACGDFGIALKMYRNSVVYGLERESSSADVARRTGAYVDVTEIDLDILSPDDFPEYLHRFDYVVCGDVLEHLREPMRVLSILKNYLVHGGYLIVSIPNISHASIKANLLLNDFTYTPVGLLDETHIRFFTYKSISESLSKIGLCIHECSFTMCDIHGLQPMDPYPLLSDDIKKFLFEDYHSFVWQYVMKISISCDTMHNIMLYNNDKIKINELNCPLQLKKYREYALSFMIDTCNKKLEKIISDNFIKIKYEKLKKNKYKKISFALICLCMIEIICIIILI